MLRDLTLENPIRAIREISHDTTCTPQGAPGQRPRGLAPSTSRASTSTEALRYAETKDLSPLEKQALQMWEHCLTTHRATTR